MATLAASTLTPCITQTISASSSKKSTVPDNTVRVNPDLEWSLEHDGPPRMEPRSFTRTVSWIGSRSTSPVANKSRRQYKDICKNLGKEWEV